MDTNPAPELKPEVNMPESGQATKETAPVVETPSVPAQQPQNQAPPVDPATVDQATQAISQTADPVEEDKEEVNLKVEHRPDEFYLNEAEEVIDKDKGDPYKQEEDHEDIQIDYLKDRFGKDVKKS